MSAPTPTTTHRTHESAQPTCRKARLSRELCDDFLLAVDDFTGLLFDFFFEVCLVVLCVVCLTVGAGEPAAGAALAGAGAGAGAPEAA